MAQNYAAEFQITMMADILRSDLNKIYQWSLDFQMSFNVDKCSVLDLVYNNKEYDYKLGCDVHYIYLY